MKKNWSQGPYESNVSPGSQGLNLIRRYASGEKLSPQEMTTARAAMYLLTQYLLPPREWEGFRWQGPDHFIEKIWPQVKDRDDVFYGYFGDGGKAP